MKKRLFLIALFMACITMLYVVKSFALFETEGSATSELTIGKWTILINNEDVTFSESVSLNSFVYDSDAHVRPGYIAPGNGGTFTIDLDASDTDVTMACTIEMDDAELEDHPNIWVETENTTKQNLINSDTDYMVIINHNDTVKNTIVTYSLNWENNSLYDEEDTELIDGEINVYFNVHCEQYLGE